MTTNKKVRFEELLPFIEEKIRAGNCFSFCAFGSSMLPFIRNGTDLVTLGPVEKKLGINDIVFYRRKNGQFVLHRIVRVCPDGSFDLCGDHQYRIEKGILPEQIIAKLVGLERQGKKVPIHSLGSRLWCLHLPVRRFCLHVRDFLIFRAKKLQKK